MAVFQGWNSFFQMTGGAAANLMGLLFVVVTLARQRDRSVVLRAASIYLTPTALHFAVALLVSGVALAPALAAPGRAAVVGLAALLGLGNGAWACIAIANPRPGAEAPHWSDFWMYGAAPAASYVGLGAAAMALWSQASWAAYAVAAALLALLLLGIRNAWDLVTWMAPRADRGSDPDA